MAVTIVPKAKEKQTLVSQTENHSETVTGNRRNRPSRHQDYQYVDRNEKNRWQVGANEMVEPVHAFSSRRRGDHMEW